MENKVTFHVTTLFGSTHSDQEEWSVRYRPSVFTNGYVHTPALFLQYGPLASPTAEMMTQYAEPASPITAATIDENIAQPFPQFS